MTLLLTEQIQFSCCPRTRNPGGCKPFPEKPSNARALSVGTALTRNSCPIFQSLWVTSSTLQDGKTCAYVSRKPSTRGSRRLSEKELETSGRASIDFTRRTSCSHDAGFAILCNAECRDAALRVCDNALGETVERDGQV